jgi:hypothetical protein
MTKSTNLGEDIWQRFAELLGEPRLSNKIAAVLGIGPKHVFVRRKEGWPAYAATILEFMEITPRHKWPEQLRLRIELASTPGAP